MTSLMEVRCCGWIVECCCGNDVDQRCLRLWKFAAVGAEGEELRWWWRRNIEV
jgi:hypothetical protein